MKRLTLRLVVALITFVSSATISVLWIVPRVEPVVESQAATDDAEAQNEDAAPDDEEAATFKDAVKYKGASFRYSPLLASGVQARTVAAHPNLQHTTDKLEGIPVKHLAFTFEGSSHLSTFWGAPEIAVYRLEDYEKGLNKSENYSENARETIQTLKHILSKRPAGQELKKVLAKRPSHGTNDVPILPFLDSTQVFRARVKYVDFKNGKAVAFLTQYNIEASLINNQGLAYVFQGITDDGVHGITAIFPVTAPFLPKDFNVKSTEGYTPPENFYLLRNESKQYQSYLKTVVPRLEALAPDKFKPGLNLFEELIATLEVRGQV